MANISFLLVLLVLSFSSLTFARLHSSSSPNDLIGDVCSSDLPDPSFCSKVLRSDPRTRGTDLFGLGRVAIDLAQSNGKSVVQLVHSLAKKASDPKLKEAYDSCSKKYDDAMTHLSGAFTDLNSGNYVGVDNHAYTAGFLADSCDNDFLDSHYNLTEPPQLSQASSEFMHFCGIILAIAEHKLNG